MILKVGEDKPVAICTITSVVTARNRADCFDDGFHICHVTDFLVTEAFNGERNVVFRA
jgi:hypothetical protein